MKPIVIGIIIKRVGGEWRILTQKRIVQNKAYDPLYDGTWEAVGETINPGESFIDALMRGISEECGAPSFKPKAIWSSGFKNSGPRLRTTGKDDQILANEPFDFVQQMGPPQPWIGPVYLVEAYRNFEPDPSKNDGEASEARWWSPDELQKELELHRGRFMGLHYPSLEKVAEWCDVHRPGRR
jgi:hypothetical protein